tara:strand:+ start:308 stop:517 length:210 start_codon:yes stop_codon:yes gene_type:complete
MSSYAGYSTIAGKVGFDLEDARNFSHENVHNRSGYDCIPSWGVVRKIAKDSSRDYMIYLCAWRAVGSFS